MRKKKQIPRVCFFLGRSTFCCTDCQVGRRGVNDVKMSFEDYCSDVLNMHVGLASAQELAEARTGFAAFMDRKTAASVHPDAKLPLAQLRQRCERLVQSQLFDARKYAGTPGYEVALQAGAAAIALGQHLLAKRATKEEFIVHAAINSDASRLFNAAKAGQ